MMVVCRTLICTVIVGGSSRQKLRHFVILNMTILNSILVLPAYFQASLAADNSDAALKIFIPWRSGIINFSHSAVHEAKINQPAVFKLRKVFMVEGGHVRLCMPDG